MEAMDILLIFGILLLGALVDAETCANGERQVLKGTDCTAFEECVDGITHLKQCISGYIFDSFALKCKRKTEARCTDLTNDCDGSKVYPLSSTCKSYKQCVKGKIVIKLCPVGQIFDPKISSCKPGLSCENCAEGDVKASSTCVTYDVCKNGRWRESYCSPFFKFNPELRKCVWYSKYDCKNNKGKQY